MRNRITSRQDAEFARQLDTVSWGLFIIWIGTAILLDFGWDWGLLGVAAIILGGAAIRWLKGLSIQGFWVAVGSVLLVCALWEFFAISWPLIPVLIIGFGLVVLLGAFRDRRPRQRPGQH